MKSKPKPLKPRNVQKRHQESSAAKESLPVVGIGASAGGLEACTELFRHLPLDTGAAFVLVQHLDPTHESVLPELLSRVARRPVLSVQNRMRLLPNHIYVIPPNASMTIGNGVLSLQPREDSARHHRVIDRFLESLAADQGHRAIGVILSGTATDGTIGLNAIKAEGGITFAQDDSAKFESMPRSAIAAGSVDFVLSPDAIAREVARITRNRDFHIPSQTAQSRRSPDAPFRLEDGFADILRLVRKATGVDFTHYKPATVERRIVRRMILNKLTGLKQYYELIEATPGEAEALYQDLLISVTGFFRNPETFDALKKQVFPEILRHRGADETVRVWVYGCSTGEEAYSIAMAFMEFCRSRDIDIPMQIFATDLNETGIEHARAGLYSKATTDISPERLRRFFSEVDGRYQINKAVRDMCVFARQNLITDPPFSHMDLVSCRNVLIYLDGATQRKIVPMFHYALKPHGLLVLGASESIGSSTDLFEPADHKYKIYKKKPAAPRFDFGKLPGLDRMTGEQPPPRRIPGTTDIVDDDAYAQHEADRILLSSYSPAAVLINKDMEIVQYRGAIGTYLEPASGKATHNLLKMSRSGLLLPLRQVIQEVIRKGRTAQTAPLKHFKDMKTLRIKVVPVRTPRAGVYFLVIFQPKGQPATAESEKMDAPSGSPKSARTRESRFEEELKATKEYLQSLLDQQQAYVEELQSSNEEVQSSNEELQTLNEEMETSKEEIQATNEELTTLNDEMQNRNKELHQLNDDLTNLFQSVRTPIVMVDREQRLRRFTPAAEKMFHLRDIDIGHPLPDFKLSMPSSDLANLMDDSIDKDRFSEKEVQDNRGCWFALQVGPYKTANDKTVGAIILLKDIDAIHKSEAEVRVARDYAEAIIRTMRQPVLVLSGDLRVKTANRAFYQLFGAVPKDTEGQFIYDLGNRQWDIPNLRRLLQEVLLENTHVLDFEVTHDFPGIGPRTMVVNATRLIERDPQSQLILLAIEDVTNLRRTEAEHAAVTEKERAAHAEVEAASQVKDEFLATVSHELRTPLNAIFGWSRLLNQGKLDPSQRTRAMEAIERNAQAQVKLVDDLMEIARIISGKLALQFQSVDAVAAVAASIETVRPIAESKNIELKVSAAPVPAPVQADPDRLQQVLWNLLSNAIKFTPVGGRVEVSSRHTDSQVEIVVSDNGQGIKPEFLPRVFQRFTQADSSSTRGHGGLGLGLAIARQLIELHGGAIEASSPGEGRGATFTVRLPYRPEMAHHLREAEAEQGQPIPKGLRVLVVDDESEARELLILMFQHQGAKIKAVDSSQEALKLLKSWRPAVLIADIGMPEMDGYQLIRHIRKLPKTGGGKIPAIAVTAYASELDRKRALDAGYQTHIAKPFTPERLMVAVAKLIGEERQAVPKKKPTVR